MVRASGVGLVGFFLLVSVAIAPACGDITEVGSQNDPCAAAAEAGDCAARDQDTSSAGARKHGQKGKGGTAGNTTGTTGSAGAGGGDGANAGKTIMLPCTLCVRAEACCKAEGHAECAYTAACASASLAEQMQFYVVLCRGVLEASAAGGKKPPDVCGIDF